MKTWKCQLTKGADEDVQEVVWRLLQAAPSTQLMWLGLVILTSSDCIIARQQNLRLIAV